MLTTQTDNLPVEQRRQLDPEFLANEQSYLRMRDQLLVSHQGQWVAVRGDQVIAAGPDLLAVTQAAAASGGYPYIALVGREDEVVFRVRSVTFTYDRSYQPFALPQITATFANHSGTASQTYSNVIPDTGADLSVLPDVDCRAIGLFRSPYFTAMSSGVVGAPVTTLVYQGSVAIDGHLFPALIQPVTSGRERIVGRDVLNQQRVLFDGPAGQVVVDP